MTRFVADAMLGRLAKWLRALGFDVHYDPSLDDHAVIARARERGAIALTGDTEFPKPADVRVIFIESDRLKEQLAQLVRDVPLDLKEAKPFTRCIVCNRELVPATRDEVWRDIPPFIYLTNETYARCPECRRVYWEGSHAAHMRESVKAWSAGAKQQ
ncbi:MAG: Mut7-C RNAse domain-containing protein [Armatimonadota bacterium]